MSSRETRGRKLASIKQRETLELMLKSAEPIIDPPCFGARQTIFFDYSTIGWRDECPPPPSCTGCEFSARCLLEGMLMPYGVWGGMSATDRAKVLRKGEAVERVLDEYRATGKTPPR